MDLSLLRRDDQTQSSPLVDSQSEDLDLSLLDSPRENKLSACTTGSESVSDLSDPTDASLVPSLTVSISLAQEKSADSGCLKPLSSSCKIPECFSLYSEPVLKDDDFSVHGCSGSSLPLLPHLSHDRISPTSECCSEIHTQHDSGLSFSLKQYNSKPRPSGTITAISEGLMESPITKLLSSHSFSSGHSQATFLIPPLSPQSDSSRSDTATALVSDLYIFESDTQDFIPDTSVASHEITCAKYQQLSQTVEEDAGGDSDTHVLMRGSAGAVTQYHRSSSQERIAMNDESDEIQRTRLRPNAVDASEVDLILVNNATQRKAESTGSSPQPWRGDSPTDMWQDACQYLAGEDSKDQDVLDETGRSVIQGGLSTTTDLSFLPEQTRVSVYNAEVSEWIGWSGDEPRGPPFERWSSVDSWASALSDWTGIIAAPAEDITAAFTEIGAEIDALTQKLAEVQVDPEISKKVHSQETAVKAPSQPSMVVQDHPLEAQKIPKSSVLSGLSCPSLCFEAAAHSKSVESLCDSTLTTEGEKESEETQNNQADCCLCPTLQQSPMGSSDTMAASSEGYGADVIAVTLMPGSTSFDNLDFSHFDGYVESLDTDILVISDEDPIILNITEDTDVEEHNAPAESQNGEVRLLRTEICFVCVFFRLIILYRVERCASLTMSNSGRDTERGRGSTQLSQ